jgi:hypothetical protein
MEMGLREQEAFCEEVGEEVAAVQEPAQEQA